MHPRTVAGRETLDPAAVALWLEHLRTQVPGAVLSVSTGAWIGPLEARLGAIRAWRVRPDFASVNFHEDGAERVADALLERGIGVEAGVWHAEGAARFLAYPRRRFCRRLMLEMPDATTAEVETVLEETLGALEAVLDAHDVILHGEGQSAWPMLRRAFDRGWHGRIGLEDTTFLRDGRGATDNAALLQAALAYVGHDRAVC
jgi:uncharacterized protein (DUF849 family)